MGGKWSVSVLLLCPYAPPFGGGNIRSVIFGFPRLWVCRWLQPQPPTIRTASILASSGTLAPLAVWLFICSVSALCGGSLAVSLPFFVVRSLFSRQKADKGRKIPLCATFPPSVGCRSALVASVPCRLSIGFAPLLPSAPRGCRLPCAVGSAGVGAWKRPAVGWSPRGCRPTRWRYPRGCRLGW